MHQVFYIDSEEEITSIIDRLRKSKVVDNVFVIPSRALVLGSIVSLKLLKSKADEMGKRVIIVTQDEQGKDLAQKSGFAVQENMDGIEVSSESIHAPIERVGGASLEPEDRSFHLEVSSGSDLSSSQRTSMPSMDMSHKKSVGGIRPASSSERAINGVSGGESGLNDGGGREYQIPIHKTQPQAQSQIVAEPNQEKMEREHDLGESVVLSKEPFGEKKEDVSHKKIITPRVKMIFSLFLSICVLLVAVISAYLFLPKADIFIYPQSSLEKIDLSVRAQVDSQAMDLENRIIGAQFIEFNDSVVIAKNSTGEEFASSQKARGRVTIYNEYSEDDQSLVATTRLETEDGKIFRLVKGVTVPGMKEEDGEKVPGKVDVDVVADKSGDQYNISPTDFTIPGFKGSPKYEKFYAKSEKKMLGGGSQGEKVKVVSQDDIDSAKKEAEAQLKINVIQKIEENLEVGYVLDSDTMKTEIVSASSFPVKDSVADSFEYQLEMKVSVMVFSEDDLVDLIRYVVEDKLGENENSLELTDVKVEYGQISPDFDSRLLDVSVHSDISLQSRIDEEKIVQEFLGVRARDFKAVVDANPEIKKIEVEFWPKILTSSIPKKRDRVKIHIKQE